MRFRKINCAKGFTSFEFYFVLVVIGFIFVIGVQRYWQLAEDTDRFSFEVLAHHFNTGVYQAHTRWLLAKQNREEATTDIVNDSISIQMSRQGWPINAMAAYDSEPNVSLAGCYQLWISLLQNPEPISYAGGDAYGSRKYHLTLTKELKCHYELVTKVRNEFFFDYSPITGQTLIHTPAKNITH